MKVGFALFAVFLGLVVANFGWEFFKSKLYLEAFEKTYSQGFALIAAFVALFIQANR